MLLSILISLAAVNHTVPLTNADGRIIATGVMLNPWTVLTASHAVNSVGEVVFLRCGEDEAAGHVTRKGRVIDLAVVTLYKPCRNVPAIELAEAEPIPGDKVTIEGYPSRKYTLADATVEGYQLFGVKGSGNGFGLFWIAMVLQGDVRPGSSGGPVFSKNGKLCGIVHGFNEAMPGKPGVAVPLRAIAQFLSSTED